MTAELFIEPILFPPGGLKAELVRPIRATLVWPFPPLSIPGDFAPLMVRFVGACPFIGILLLQEANVPRAIPFTETGAKVNPAGPGGAFRNMLALMPRHYSQAQKEHMAARRQMVGGANLQGLPEQIGTLADRAMPTLIELSRRVHELLRAKAAPAKETPEPAAPSKPLRTNAEVNAQIDAAQARIDELLRSQEERGLR